MNFTVKLGYASVTEFLERQVKETRGLDLNRSGMFVRTDKIVSIGTEVSFSIGLKDGTRVISGQGIVKWNAPPGSPEAARRGAGLGIEFSQMDDDSRGIIHTIVAAREELKRGGPAPAHLDPTSNVEPPPKIPPLAPPSNGAGRAPHAAFTDLPSPKGCLLYTSDAADE